MSEHHDPGSPARPDQPLYPHVRVQLTGRNGNAYAVIAAVAAALRQHVGDEQASNFACTAFSCGSYDDLLHLAMSTVDVC